MRNFEFQNPWLLLLLLLIPLLIWLRYRNRNPDSAVKISTLKPFEFSDSWLGRLKPLLNILRWASLALLIVALARPRIVHTSSTVRSDHGIDILMVVDTSLSMLARDLKPDRLEALKEVAEKFALDRPSDRIGLVDYSGEAVTRVPLTTDRQVLIDEIRSLETGRLADGTAIGIGLATAVNHLKDSEAASKVIILITDGVESIDFTNDLLYVSPQDAAKMALDRGIKVYTVGIGTNGNAPFPTYRDMFTGELVFTMQPVEIDEESMRYIAALTGGKYFRVTDNRSLTDFYDQIDRMEKTEINEVKYYNYTELYHKYLMWALILLFIELILRKTIYKEIN